MRRLGGINDKEPEPSAVRWRENVAPPLRRIPAILGVGDAEYGMETTSAEADHRHFRFLCYFLGFFGCKCWNKWIGRTGAWG